MCLRGSGTGAEEEREDGVWLVVSCVMIPFFFFQRGNGERDDITMQEY